MAGDYDERIYRDLLLQDYREKWEESKLRLQYSKDFAELILKSLFLINGGGIVALLTFLGNSDVEYSERGVFWSFVWLSIGSGLILVAHFAAYFSQVFYMNVAFGEAWNSQAEANKIPRPNLATKSFYKFGTSAEYTGVATAILSLSAFIVGIFVALDAIT